MSAPHTSNNKSRGLMWAMAAYPTEYMVDTEIQDMFGLNESFQGKAMLRQTDVTQATSLVEVQFSESLDVVSGDIRTALKEHGHCLLRYAGKEPLTGAGIK